jgi:hypothetical protein
MLNVLKRSQSKICNFIIHVLNMFVLIFLLLIFDAVIETQTV